MECAILRVVFYSACRSVLLSPLVSHCQVADSKDGPESLSVDRALRAMKRADVVVMVIDASEGITQQVGI